MKDPGLGGVPETSLAHWPGLPNFWGTISKMTSLDALTLGSTLYNDIGDTYIVSFNSSTTGEDGRAPGERLKGEQHKPGWFRMEKEGAFLRN